ncbi:unnamed protein product [Fraxinus pennsylvanica]|uniref:Protein kinase domain-containing protein n=1 Tax=Fraxinus pennsylvanica TaxID=56036 RepID=A0AAD2A432_9LAMI|nr:unnamed protein product [Fraxinus pennsylvanica]
MLRVGYFFLLFLSLLCQVLVPSTSSGHQPRRVLLQNGNVSNRCPLDFGVLRKGKRPSNVDIRSECQYVKQGIRLVESEYLRVTSSFLPPLDSAESCWDSYESLVNEYEPIYDIRSRCGFETEWIARGCMNITTRSEFESVIPRKDLDDVVSACNQSLLNNSPCATCTTAISRLQASYLTGPSIGNVSDCTAYPFVYVAAFANHFGPTNEGTAKCLFNIDFTSSGFWFFRRRRKKILKRKLTNATNEVRLTSGLDSISGSTTLIRFKFDEIKAATKNFSREHIIGRGGYGNVYKGVLPDGSEVALKRFKNCSASGDASFTHEVEVIASIRHVNLVALRGFGVVLLELLSGKKALIAVNDGQPTLITDWAWSLVRNGRALEVVEDMPDLGPPDVVEKYVLVAVLCSHPQLHARPTMDQVVKLLDTDVSIPSIPERPISLIANIDDIERLASSSGSGNLSTPAGYQHYTFDEDRPQTPKKDNENSDGW